MRELEICDGTSRLVLSKNFGSLLSAPGHSGTQSETQPSAGLPPKKQEKTANSFTTALTQDEVDKTLQKNTDPGFATITSPIVGTFYASPGPDSPAFVTKGSKVKKGGTLCILEAMKMMNKLEAEFDCEIIDIKVEPGQLVEYEQPLFEVRHL